LLAALEDLNQGRVALMLKPTRFGNRPPEGSNFRQLKAFALFAVQRLVTHGDSVSGACRKVAQVWNTEAPQARRSAGAIRSWYNRSRLRGEDDVERVALDTLRQAAEQDTCVRDADALATLSRVLRSIPVAE